MTTTTSNSSKQQDTSNQAPSLQTAISQAVNGTLAAPLEAVILLLRAADKIADTVYGDVKRAAHLAAQVMSPGLTPKEKKDQVLAVYAQLWLEIKDDNLKRDFTNLLWIYADPKAQVTVPKPVKSGEAPQTQVVDAIKVLNGMSKKTITDVSKQIRDIHDAGRASGAGRPRKEVPGTPVLPANPLPNTGTPLVAPPVTTAPTPPMNTSGVVTTPPVTPLLTPSANPAVSTGTLQPGATSTTTTPTTLPAPSKPAPAQPAKATVTSKVSVEEQDAAFYGELKVRLAIPGDAAKIHAAVEAGGYTVRRKANVTPAKGETPKDKTTILAEQLLNATPATAIQIAAQKAAEAKIAKDAATKPAINTAK